MTGGVTIDLPTPARVLAVGAHPDDAEFGAGATLAKWSAAGAAVHLLVLTDGAKGTWDPEADLRALAEVRRAEQEAAAAVLGIESVTFLDLTDGELTEGLAERSRVCAVVRRTRPTVVVTHDPWRRYRLHPDHRHAGFLVLDALTAARDPHFFPEQGLAPHRPEHVLLFEAEEVDHLETVEGSLERKVEALLRHRSQWRSTMAIDERHAEVETQRAEFVKGIRNEAVDAGAGAEIPAAEAFKLLTERELGGSSAPT